MSKGLFITIYGINNIGKSTHAKKLVERLKQHHLKAVYFKYPVYDLEPTGPFLNMALRSPDGQKISEDELQLWFVLNRYQFEHKIKELLADGYIVVAEDYSGTGIAWGIAKGLDEEWLLNANKYLLKEDFSILFEGERTLSAREDIHVHEQNDSLVSRCQTVHSYLAEKNGWARVQVQPKIEDTAELLLSTVEKELMSRDIL